MFEICLVVSILSNFIMSLIVWKNVNPQRVADKTKNALAVEFVNRGYLHDRDLMAMKVFIDNENNVKVQ